MYDEYKQLQVSKNKTLALQIPPQSLVVFNNTGAFLCTYCYTVHHANCVSVSHCFHCMA